MAKRSNIRSFTIDELYEEAGDDPGWLVDGVLPIGELVLLVGEPKKGKSWLALDLAVSLSLAEPFIGIPTITERSVLFCNFEDGAAELARRLKMRLTAERPETAARFDIVPARGETPQEFVAFLTDAVRTGLPGLVVIDPLAELLGGLDENDSRDMSNLLRPLRNLAHDFGTTILVVHHRRKAGGAGGSGARGSSAIRSASAGDIDYYGDVSGASVTTHLRRAQTTSYRVRMGENGHWERLPDREVGPTLGERILAALANGHLGKSELVGITGGTDGSVAGTLSRLVASGQVTSGRTLAEPGARGGRTRWGLSSPLTLRTPLE